MRAFAFLLFAGVVAAVLCRGRIQRALAATSTSPLLKISRGLPGNEAFYQTPLPVIQAQITLGWSNSPTPDSITNYVTGLMASTDLSNWYQIYLIPYATGNVFVTLSNRPAAEFYRAFNRQK